MPAQAPKLPANISSALADYIVRNPETANRLAGMRPEHAAAALRRLQRWIDTKPARSAG
jgi:hypothetical protein